MNIPNKWREQFPHALIEQQAIGESRADVFRLRRDNGTDLFLKAEPLVEHAELADEIERLHWLQQQGLEASGFDTEYGDDEAAEAAEASEPAPSPESADTAPSGAGHA
mgnify:CR=1 FL=1